MNNKLYKIENAATGKFIDYVFANDAIDAEHKALRTLPKTVSVKVTRCK